MRLGVVAVVGEQVKKVILNFVPSFSLEFFGEVVEVFFGWELRQDGLGVDGEDAVCDTSAELQHIRIPGIDAVGECIGCGHEASGSSNLQDVIDVACRAV